ncbi:hypothetical protein TNCV_5014781 [Trichonephila clavipes]|nr:hypothetical protein TNCV_5014781 [Trichonephila clavipes]
MLKLGDMVIIKEDNLPSCHWPLGRINNIYPGKDSNVRVVEVKTTRGRFLDLPFDLYQRISATNRVPTFTVPLANHNSAIQTIQDFTAETVCKKNPDSVATPPCHVRPTNQDTHSQAGPPTSGHIHYLDMGWRNASRSVSQ